MAQAANGAASAAITAAASTAAQDRKRVKVYELKNNDWYDRGTGFCAGQYVGPQDAPADELDARILVVAEEDANRTLLETRITKDDGYQKQQDTLIVWTETNGIDMALSFQEAEGCTSIWEFVSGVQDRFSTSPAADAMSDDIIDPGPMALPEPQLGRLEEVENQIRLINSSPAMRNALPKYVVTENYLLKLAPLVTMAEDLEQVQDLHRLCSIMKHLILLNDTEVIEFAVRDEAIMGVVGALEYDPDFPSHRANHRQYLSDASKFKEVVPIQDENIRSKIHWTFRLQYLKDVVLARILDDPTFGVLNSLIYFNQVDIMNHLHGDPAFLRDLFDIFSATDPDRADKKKQAVLFIQNCCAVSKNIQAQNRAQLYQIFIHHGLFGVITFALRHHDDTVRVAGTDILVALIDHDAQMVRNHVFAAMKEKKVPLTDTLIELLLVEVDLGVKSQMADALKILLDPSGVQPGMEILNRQGANPELIAKQRGMQPSNAQANQFLDHFYDSSAKRLFAPLKALVDRPTMRDLTVQEISLFTHLTEILAFFVRQHSYKSKYFILAEKLHDRIGQLLYCPQKYMKLAALKWFRTCVGLQDEFHNRQMIASALFDPILGIVEATMPRDNLLNSACLELFEYIKREVVKQLVFHLVEMYRERLMAITYVNTFQGIVLKYDQLNEPYQPNGIEDSSFTTQEGTPHRLPNGRQSFAGLKEMDNDEEAYFNADDDVDDDEALPTTVKLAPMNGASPVRPLVNYPLDDDDDGMDILASSPDPLREKKSSSTDSSDDPQINTDESYGYGQLDEPMDEDSTSPTGAVVDEEQEHGRDEQLVPAEQGPPESLATKRRREEDDEDELGKIMSGAKRRNSSVSSTRSELGGGLEGPTQNGGLFHGHPQQQTPQTQTLRRKESFKAGGKDVAEKFRVKPISLAAVKQQAEAAKGEEDAGGAKESVQEAPVDEKQADVGECG